MTWTWQLLRAGTFKLDGGAMFGIIPKPLWAKACPPDDRNRIPLQTNCLLLSDGDRRVLIETGCGEKWTDKDRDIFALEKRSIRDALGEVGTDPADIDVVIVTHLHFDHAGGLTHLNSHQEPVSTFANAKIVVQQTEWDDALANKSTMKATYLRSHLDPIAPQVHLVAGEEEALPGLDIVVEPMIGHTWGQQAVRFADAQGVVCFPGDVMPTVHHAGSAYNMGYDMLPYANMHSKRRLLERACEGDWRLALDHEPGEAIVRVRRESDRPDRFTLQTVDAETCHG